MTALTQWLTAIAASGRLAEIAMAVLMLELVAFLFIYRSAATRRALRSALIGHGPLVIAGFLSLGFALHLGELRFRHRAFTKPGAPPPSPPD